MNTFFRNSILTALRSGTVPQMGLASLAVGLDPFKPVLEAELEQVAQGAGLFKAVRGDYGHGKTFYSRWFREQARERGFAAAEVQMTELETVLHHPRSIYRAICTNLLLPNEPTPGFQGLLESWAHRIQERVVNLEEDPNSDNLLASDRFMQAYREELEKSLVPLNSLSPIFALALRAYCLAMVTGDLITTRGLSAWLACSGRVSSTITRPAGLKGDPDDATALDFLRCLLTILRTLGIKGLVLTLDEVDTLHRFRRDTRDKGLEALRRWIDELTGGKFPGLYLNITGTTSFFEGGQGIQRLTPLAQRLDTWFGEDPSYDNLHAIQIRLHRFDKLRLMAVACRVRDLFAVGSRDPERIGALVSDAWLSSLIDQIGQCFGGELSMAPRIFLKKLVADVLDRIELHPEWDPQLHYLPVLSPNELTTPERLAGKAINLNDLEIAV